MRAALAALRALPLRHLVHVFDQTHFKTSLSRVENIGWVIHRVFHKNAGTTSLLFVSLLF